LAATPGIQSKLFITIAAGITTESIKTALGGSVSVVRALPNTPMLIGQGVIAVCQAPTVATEDFDFVCDLFRASGSVLVIDESEMNRIISVTSSSPAYVFAFIRALCDGAAMQGLSLSDKDLLDSVCDMVIGAATLLKTGTKTPAEQISTVTSKGGTTERAMSVLADGDFEGLLHRAMQACTDRADELSRNV
jgi:pyrroline-5-carboxylate reductase